MENTTSYSYHMANRTTAISKDTLARCVREVTLRADIDVTKLKPHNARGVSASNLADNYLLEANNINTRATC